VFGRRTAAVVVAAFVALSAFGGRADAPAKMFPPVPASMTIAGLPAWLRANTDVPPASLVALVRGVVTILADPGERGATGLRANIVVRREALSDSGASAIGGRSELVRLEIDCNASQYRLTSRSVYPGNGLTGSAHVIAPTAPMVDVPPNTDLAFLLRAVCDPAYQPPLTPYLASAPAAPPAVATQAPTPVAQPPAPAAPPPALVVQQQAPRSLAPMPQSPAPVAHPPTPIAQQQAPQTTIAQTAQPPAPAAEPQATRAQASQVRPRAPAGKFVAQVAASASEALAHRLLANLTRRVPEVADMPTSVDRVRVKDAVLFRVSIGGFQTSSIAEAFCVRLRSASFPCWVR
jgi:hypothetical protein